MKNKKPLPKESRNYKEDRVRSRLQKKSPIGAPQGYRKRVDPESINANPIGTERGYFDFMTICLTFFSGVIQTEANTT